MSGAIALVGGGKYRDKDFGKLVVEVFSAPIRQVLQTATISEGQPWHEDKLHLIERRGRDGPRPDRLDRAQP